jgi:RNA polymerase sigma-54 factor
MALEAKLSLKLGQSLLMTPQLQQAIKLLAMGQLEFKEAIEQEMLENPILEEVREVERDAKESAQPETEQFNAESSPFSDDQGSENDKAGQSLQDSKVDWEDYLDRFTDPQGAATPRGLIDFTDRPSAENLLSTGESLVDYLLQQLRMMNISREDQEIILQIVGNLDRDGYLCSSYEEIATQCCCEVSDVMRVMELFRSFDPPGIGARDLKECLLIQLDHIGMSDGLAAHIVREHLDKLEKRKFDQIARQESIEVEKVYQAVLTIQSLEPRPARSFNDETPRYITPDIYVERDGDEFVISLNEDGLPKVRISPYYLKILQDKDAGQSAQKGYLQERLKAASWLIKSIHQRQHTIYRVTESIVKFQRDFMLNGIDRLKPLVLKDVADDIGMHESTVSRVTTNKYVHTPQGIFELKFFFTSGIRAGAGDMSSSAVKERIRTLIGAENPKNPISDQEIVEVLKRENIDIARRTVAKYRENLGILSSSKRKKVF